MLFGLFILIFCPSFTFGNEFLEINWNSTTSLMLNEYNTHYNNCDLTDGVCDKLCCSDPDCSERQIAAFNCLFKKHEPYGSEGYSFLFINSPYLGMFYYAPPVMEDLNKLKALFSKQSFKAKPTLPYKYGDAILVVSGKEKIAQNLIFKSHPVAFSGICKNTDVRYSVNSTATCQAKVSFESCNDQYELSVIPFLLNINSTLDLPLIVANTLTMNNVFVKLNILNISNGQNISNLENIDDLLTKYNGKLGACFNVMQSAHIHFELKGNVIVNVFLNFNISVVRIYNGNQIAISQAFSVTNRDISINEACEKCSENIEYFNRGYFIGEKLITGNLDINETTSWTPAHISLYAMGKLNIIEEAVEGVSIAGGPRLSLINQIKADARCQNYQEAKKFAAGRNRWRSAANQPNG